MTGGISPASPTSDRRADRRLPRHRPSAGRRHRGLRAVACLLAALLTAGNALGQPDAARKQARALQVEGLRLLEKGDDRGALERFDEAFRLVASPKILFNRAKAHLGLGEEVEALSDFERFLDEAPYAPKRSREEATRAAEALRPKLAYLDVDAEDAGSTIRVDGKEVGTAPLPRPIVVAPGSHEIRVAKAGMNDEVRTVSPLAGQKLRVAVKLTPVAAPDTSTAKPALTTGPLLADKALAGGAPVEAEDDHTRSPERAATPEQPWQRTATWVALGSGVVLLGAGVTAQALRSSKSAQFNDTSNGGQPCNERLPMAGGGACKTLDDDIHQLQTWAIVGYVASGAAFVTALIFHLTTPDPSTAGDHPVAVACSPSATQGVSCALTLTF
jgi:tetratricopeptide (TPR) repeat protein